MKVILIKMSKGAVSCNFINRVHRPWETSRRAVGESSTRSFHAVVNEGTRFHAIHLGNVTPEIFCVPKDWINSHSLPSYPMLVASKWMRGLQRELAVTWKSACIISEFARKLWQTLPSVGVVPVSQIPRNHSSKAPMEAARADVLGAELR